MINYKKRQESLNTTWQPHIKSWLDYYNIDYNYKYLHIIDTSNSGTNTKDAVIRFTLGGTHGTCPIDGIDSMDSRRVEKVRTTMLQNFVTKQVGDVVTSTTKHLESIKE